MRRTAGILQLGTHVCVLCVLAVPMANVSILVCISVRLVSPKFPPRRSCTLKLLYKVCGIPPAILSVLVSEEGANLPKDSGECNIVINTSNCLLI